MLPPHAVIGHAHPFACVVLEILFKFSDNPAMRWMRNSRSLGTLLFMVCSGGILHFMKRHGASVFWFILPQKSPHNNEVNACDHKSSCRDYIVQGLKQYAIYGIILELLKNLFSRMPQIKKRPHYILWYLIRNPNFKFLKFLVVYIGLYRAASCWINHNYKKARDYSSFVGGVAGGLSYSLCPNYNLFTSAIITLAQVSLKAHDT